MLLHFYTNPNNPLVSAMINLTPLAWQKSPTQSCSSRHDCVSTTTWKTNKQTKSQPSSQTTRFCFRNGSMKIRNREHKKVLVKKTTLHYKQCVHLTDRVCYGQHNYFMQQKIERQVLVAETHGHLVVTYSQTNLKLSKKFFCKLLSVNRHVNIAVKFRDSVQRDFCSVLSNVISLKKELK